MYRKRRTNSELPDDVRARNELDSQDINYNIAATILTLDLLIKNAFPDKNQRKELVVEAYATAIARTQQSKSNNFLISVTVNLFSLCFYSHAMHHDNQKKSEFR